ncbi:hypothetical protein NPIL_354351 [Nephila pilipes]|uniref:Uncharacterized protein n=1 Tax=Nephila pilipes TaxID=299642 RepID=A0A8X6NIL5_NEPPI|nr:hypothetical protein NPIL_354351 [Nephila pilipes]
MSSRILKVGDMSMVAATPVALGQVEVPPTGGALIDPRRPRVWIPGIRFDPALPDQKQGDLFDSPESSAESNRRHSAHFSDLEIGLRLLAPDFGSVGSDRESGRQPQKNGTP